MLVHPVALCIADQFGGLGWIGIPLNLTNTRMLQALYKTLFSEGEGKRASAARATNDVKLFEAVFESMPQLYIQMIVLLHYSGRCAADASSATRTVALLYTSISISVLSTTLAVSIKFFTILDLHLRFEGGVADAACIAAYFFADSVTRSVAVAMFYGSHKGLTLMMLMIAMVVVDFALQAVSVSWAGNPILSASTENLLENTD